MILVTWILYYFTFIFLFYIACNVITSACDVFKIRNRGN